MRRLLAVAELAAIGLAVEAARAEQVPASR